MSRLVMQSSSRAHWHLLVGEAQSSCGTRLEPHAEAYLVGLLDHSCRRTDLFRRALALDYLEAQSVASGSRQREQLRRVGDQCLLCSGLFPRLARRRLVRISYFVRLGRSAYQQLAGLADNELFHSLAEAFVSLMELLQTIRGLDGSEVLTPLEAAELWADTGSTQALRATQRRGESYPLQLPPHRH